MADPITIIRNAINDTGLNAHARRVAVYLCACLLSLLALQISVQAGEPLSESASFECVLVQTGDIQPEDTQPKDTMGIADITICHRPLQDDAFPVMHGSEPRPEEFEVFIDMVQEPMPSGRPDWQQVMTLITLH